MTRGHRANRRPGGAPEETEDAPGAAPDVRGRLARRLRGYGLVVGVAAVVAAGFAVVLILEVTAALWPAIGVLGLTLLVMLTVGSRLLRCPACETPISLGDARAAACPRCGARFR